MTYFLIALSGIDARTQFLPDELNYPLLWIGLVFCAFFAAITLYVIADTGLRLRTYGDIGGMEMGLGHRTPLVIEHAVPLGETEVERHEHVHATDGEIGQVEGFIVNSADHAVTHVLLREGHLWGWKQVAIPVSAVASVDAGIRLNITKKQVEDLPPVDL